MFSSVSYWRPSDIAITKSSMLRNGDLTEVTGRNPDSSLLLLIQVFCHQPRGCPAAEPFRASLMLKPHSFMGALLSLKAVLSLRTMGHQSRVPLTNTNYPPIPPFASLVSQCRTLKGVCSHSNKKHWKGLGC